MEKEIWKDVVGYEGFYKVSNFGNVYSVPRTYTQITKGGKIIEHKFGGRRLKGLTNKGDYRRVLLAKDGTKIWFFVHRLVAEAFLEKDEAKPYVDHINTIKTDNRVENLRYVDAIGNANNLVTIQHNSKKIFKSNMRVGVKTHRRNNKIKSVDLRVLNNKAFLSELKSNGALLSICKSNDEKICDFWMSLESLQNLRDNITDYLELTKIKSL